VGDHGNGTRKDGRKEEEKRELRNLAKTFSQVRTRMEMLCGKIMGGKE